MKWCLALIVTAVVGVAALATCPAPVVVRKVVAVKEVAVAQVVTPVAVYTPLAVLVPTYAATYVPAPSPAPAAVPAASADTKAILDALKAIDGRLSALERTRPSPPAKPADPFAPAGDPPAPPPAEARAGKAPAVFASKCASCHTRGKESAGGDFVLLEQDGSVAKLDARAVLAAARRSYNGTMPPKSSKVPALTDAEVAEVMAWLDTQK